MLLIHYPVLPSSGEHFTYRFFLQGRKNLPDRDAARGQDCTDFGLVITKHYRGVVRQGIFHQPIMICCRFIIETK